MTNTPETMNEMLANSFMLVSCTLRKPPMTKQDVDISAQVCASHAASTGSAKLIKNIWGGGTTAALIKDLNSTLNAARQLQYKYCLPFSAAGMLLPNARYFDFEQERTQLEAEIDRKVWTIVGSYNSLVSEAQASLGTMAQDISYPTATEFEAAVGVEWVYGPVPTPSDTKDINMPASVTQRFVEQAERQRVQAIEDVQEKLWSKTLPCIQRLVDQTSDARTATGRAKPIYASLLDAAQELVGSLRHFNITGDPKLEEARIALSKLITNIDVEQIKASETLKQEVHEGARAIADMLGQVAPTMPVATPTTPVAETPAPVTAAEPDSFTFDDIMTDSDFEGLV